jgi:diguanylate cyclase (GGDEF)-like protein
MLDMRDWDTKKDKYFRIGGEWLMYPGELLLPDQIDESKKAVYYQTGTSWTSPLNGGFPSQYSATFKVKILLPEAEHNILGIIIPAFWSSDLVFINGKYHGSSGKPSIPPEETKEMLRYRFSYVETCESELEIVIWISNKTFGFGGIDATPILGEEIAVSQIYHGYIGYFFALCGMIFFVAIYLLIFYLYNRQYIKYLFLSLFSFSIMIYLTAYDAYLLPIFIKNISAATLIKTGTVNYPLAVIFLVLFIFYHLKEFTGSGLIMIAFTVFTIIIFILTIIVNAELGMTMLSILNIIVGAGSIYVTYLYIKAIKKNGKSEILHLCSWLILSITVALDMIFGFYLNSLDLFSFFSIGIIFFIITHSQLLASSFGKMSTELANSMKQYETELHKRTSWLRKMNSKLEQRIFNDELTSLYNRSKLTDPSLISEFYRENSIAVLYLDLDNFKLINDIISHNAGDIVLRTFAEIIQKLIRTTDIPIRIGGDEFIIFITKNAKEGGPALAQRIVKKTENSQIFISELENNINEDFNKEVFDRFSCSVGVLIMNYKEQEIEEIINEADKALLKAKQLGKNCVHINDLTQ